MDRSILRVVSLASILLLAACGGEAAPTPTPTPTPAATGALGHIAFRAYVDGNADIYVINADGSNQTRLTDGQEFGTMPRWSPDGSKIAFVSIRGANWDIYVMDADGSNQTRLTDSPGIDEAPVWSPDGSKIAFVSIRSGTHEIYLMDALGSNQTRITTPTPPHDPTYNSAWAERLTPIWSPDGSEIVFTSVRDGNQADIYVMEADGSNEVRITTNPASDSNPTWSPDGSKIAFVSNRRDQITAIYVMDADGSNQTLLTHFPAPPATVNRPLCCPAWSPAR